MKINVLRKMEYEKHLIYVMNFGHVFQYYFADKDKNLYQDHIEFKPSFINKLKYLLHIIPSPYSQEELDAGEQIVLSGAMKSIDAILQEGKPKKEVEPVVVELEKKKSDCMYRAVATEDKEPAWECVTHNVIVPMVDGVKPTHEI